MTTARASPPKAPPLSGAVVVLADARLFTNLALSVADNAAFVVSLFGRTPREIVIVRPGLGHGASSPGQFIARANLTAVVLQLLLFSVLLLLYKGVAFGRLREPPRPSGRAFADHVRALGNGLRARGERHATRWASTLRGPSTGSGSGRRSPGERDSFRWPRRSPRARASASRRS